VPFLISINFYSCPSPRSILHYPSTLFLPQTPTEQTNHTHREMGRAPCCDKANVKKGPWSPEEDAKLKDYIEQHGTGGNWIALPQKVGKCIVS